MSTNIAGWLVRRLAGLRPATSVLFSVLALVAVEGLLMEQGFAQTDLGGITGTVQDNTGAAIPNCEVQIKNLNTSAVRTVKTDQNGFYTVPSLTVGPYQITATVTGFQRAAKSIELTTSGANGDIQLTVGSVQQQVMITESSGSIALQTDSHDVATTVSPAQLVNLPNNGRSILNIATLGPASQPGTDVGVDVGDEGFYNQTSASVIISGLGNAHAAFLQDGVANTNLLTQTANILASVEATQEVTTLLNGAPARFSQPSVIDVITKGGSNSFHGTAYDFLQNDDFDATNWFATSKPAKRYNQFGGNVGGPILKNKVFAFFDYSGLRSRTASVNRDRVPTLAERAGDFSADNVTLYDPSTYNPATGTDLPFPNNALPALSPFAQLWLANYPAPNRPLGADNVNYVVNLPNISNYDEYLGRIDYNISGNDQLFGTVSRLQNNVGSNSITPGLFGIFNALKGTNISIAETHVFNSNIVNVIKAGYNRSNLFRTQQGQGVVDYAAKYGLVNVNPEPQQYTPPQINLNNYTSLGDPYSPQGAIQNRFQYGDEVTWKIGRHTVTFGGEFVRTQFDGNWVVGNNGIYNFDGSATSAYVGGVRSATDQGNALADLELGFPRTANAATGISLGAFRGYDFAGYVQDDLKLTPKLTLILGLRYDFNNPPSDKNGHGGLFNVPLNAVIPGTWNTNYNDWGPRVGFAYSVSPKTVLRGGYGMYYAPILYNNLQFELLYSPNFVNQSYSFDVAAPGDIQQLFASGGLTAGQQNYTLTKTLKDTSVQEWTLNIEQSLDSKTLFTLGYIGNTTRHQSARADLNQPLGLSPGNTSGILDLRPNPAVGTTDGQLNILPANYNGLITKVERSFDNGFQFLASYTFSKAMDILDGDNSDIQDLYNPHLTYGPAGFDRTNNFILSAVYQLPFGPGKKFLNSGSFIDREVFGGWQLSGIQQSATGQPIQITANNNADTSSVHSVFADKICAGTLPSGHPRLQFYDPACYVQPATGQYGTARSGPRQPGLNTTDLSLQKAFAITESHQLQFRAEAFSVFNHPTSDQEAMP
ncbi:Oar protein [Acidisarcina polymorpha]|uniref:Oar protein n=1 Tax=Acidisarcina polymorpha TaxID=2211140 RepID=A0A2Z5G2D3_9BACT|nr:TonB-dependent receptor [Acidisarcina polymorpha]AXC12825.1 Oar protein [Acidisarcina polymorpha]